jgi:peptide/nickel transport system permease protein
MAIFGLSKCAPRDPALELGEGMYGDIRQQEDAIRLRAAQLGLDKPIFYFTLTTAAFPDTLYRILPPNRRERLTKLCAQTGNWSAVSSYEAAVREFYFLANNLPDTMQGIAEFRIAATDLIKNEDVELINGMVSDFREAGGKGASNAELENLLNNLQHRAQDLKAKTQLGKMKFPAFHWYGTDNQYHRWLAGIVSGDLGRSVISQKPVWASLKFSLLSTMIINGLAILLAYCIAVPLGVGMARHRDKSVDKAARGLLLFLYAMPLFWLGSLLMLLLATPDSGLFLINGISLESYQGSGKTYMVWCLSNFDKFILPILTLSLHALAMLTLQMRGGILDNVGKDFIRTARAKGAKEDSVYWYHAFRNALFPIITVFAGLFPSVFTGSLVVEYLFQFPGLGMKTHEAYMSGDYPVLFFILMLAAALAILGNLIADLLYAWADPRVRFAK